MFSSNPTNPKGFKEQYVFYIGKYYKIWFSNNPDEFLGIENQLRLVRMRMMNKKIGDQAIEIYFIYSSNCLHDSAKLALKRFCDRYHIIPIDFDQDLPPLLKTAEDKELYAIAQEELARARAKQYGNLAAASDCVRLLVPVIENYGIYSDFDVQVRLTELGAAGEQTLLGLRAPVLLNAEIIQISENNTLISPNSDFIAFSCQEQDPTKLSNEALRAVQDLQREVIRKYKEPVGLQSIFRPDQITTIPAKIYQIMNKFRQQYPEKPSIFDFRKFIATLSLSETTKVILDRLVKMSVICFSGPENYQAIYKELLPKGVNRAPSTIPNDAKWRPYLDLYRKSSVGFYDAIANCVQGQSAVDVVMRDMDSCIAKVKADIPVRVSADNSWTEEGAALQKEREARMQVTAWKLQGFFRQKTMPYQVLLRKGKPLCTKKPEYLKLLREANYSLLLRNACNDLNLPLIRMLLQYRDKITININEVPKSGKTALDRAKSAKGKAEIKAEIIRLLERVGAKTGEEVGRDDEAKLLQPKV